MATFVKADPIPQTIVGEIGSAKRNILRKGGPAPNRKGAAAGGNIDDGSLYVDSPALNSNDPNYDSEEEVGNEAYNALSSSIREAVGHSKITLSAFKKYIEPLISSFFVNGDIEEILASLVEIDCLEYSYEFVKRVVNMSLDKADRERELVSKLLSAGYPNIFSSNMIGKGFERLFELVDEIEKDAPSARTMLATYLTRVIVDEILPPSFLSDAVVVNLGGDVVEHAKQMLSQDHNYAKLERGWGPGDGRPVEELKVAVDQILQEYILSGDVEEAARCILELGEPQFFHEVVKRAVVQSMDANQEKQEQMSELLVSLVERDQLTRLQAIKGFNHLYTILDDLVLDTPTAEAILLEFTERAITESVLPADYMRPVVASK